MPEYVSPCINTIEWSVKPVDREEATITSSHWGRVHLDYPEAHPVGPQGGATSAALPR